MSMPSKKRLRAAYRRSPAAIYLASMLGAGGVLVSGVALPYIVKRLGGNDAQIGLAVSIVMLAYVPGCLIVAPHLDRFNAKSVALLGLSFVTISQGLLCLFISPAVYQHFPIHPAWLVSIPLALQGLSLAGVWPVIVGWLSYNSEGRKLNRRLGVFNVAWCLGNIIGAALGGYFVEINSCVPLLTSLAMMIVSVLCIACAQRPEKPNHHPDHIYPSVLTAEPHPMLGHFRWAARIALGITFIGVGLTRSQFALLLKFDLGYQESNFGIAMTLFSTVCLIIFFIGGRTIAWHYRPGLFFASQVCQLIGLVMLISCTNIYLIYLAIMLVAANQGFIYISHMYYGISGGTRRAALMAIHEILLAGGFALGSLGGGYLSQLYHNRYLPFQVSIVLVMLAGIAQIIIWKKMNQTACPAA